MIAPFFESRLPVGSSARMSGGRWMIARADGDALHLAAGELVRIVRRTMPEPHARQHFVRRARGSLPSASSPATAGSATFSKTFSVGMRLKNWKMKPMEVRRSAVSRHSSSADVSTSPRNTCPRRRPVDGADEVQQRRLATARRAHQHREVAGGDLERDVVEHVHGRRLVGGTVIVPDVSQGDSHAAIVWFPPGPSSGTPAAIDAECW